MAEIAGLFAVSHTPVMTNLPGAPEASVSSAIYAEFKRVGREIAALNPDALLLISDDHLHNFFLDNLPAFCLGAADRYDSPVEGWLKVEPRELRGDAQLAAHLLDAVMTAGFDLSFSMELTLDHGMVTPLELAGIAGQYPVVPLLVNCVQPPLPRMQRCVALGKALRAAILSYANAERVVVLATGGLSHDVGTPRMGYINEPFDREFLRLLQIGAAGPLVSFAQENVNTAGNGAEEVRNWLVAHGIADCAPFDVYHYHPTIAWYTGIALGQWRRA